MKKYYYQVIFVWLIVLTGCSTTKYGIPIAEWDSLSPREKQQVIASTHVGISSAPNLFQKPLPGTRLQQQQQAIMIGNNAAPAP